MPECFDLQQNLITGKEKLSFVLLSDNMTCGATNERMREKLLPFARGQKKKKKKKNDHGHFNNLCFKLPELKHCKLVLSVVGNTHFLRLIKPPHPKFAFVLVTAGLDHFKNLNESLISKT